MDDLRLYASDEKSLESLIQTVRVFSNDIGMEFGVKKCVVLTTKKGKIANSDGIASLNKATIKRLKEGDSYKHLGVIQADGMKHHEMKEKVKTEYYRRKIIETKLNGGNILTGINTWAISLPRCSAAFLDWTGAELEQMDRRTRKLMAMHRALNPKSEVARTYLSRKGGRGLTSVEGTVILAILGYERYILTSEEGLLIAARRVDGDYEQHLELIESVKEFKERRTNERSNVLKQKKFDEQFFNHIEELAWEEKWLWLRDESIKKETESLIIAAQEQAIRTNAIKAKLG